MLWQMFLVRFLAVSLSWFEVSVNFSMNPDAHKAKYHSVCPFYFGEETAPMYVLWKFWFHFYVRISCRLSTATAWIICVGPNYSQLSAWNNHKIRAQKFRFTMPLTILSQLHGWQTGRVTFTRLERKHCVQKPYLSFELTKFGLM